MANESTGDDSTQCREIPPSTSVLQDSRRSAGLVITSQLTRKAQGEGKPVIAS